MRVSACLSGRVTKQSYRKTVLLIKNTRAWVVLPQLDPVSFPVTDLKVWRFIRCSFSFNSISMVKNRIIAFTLQSTEESACIFWPRQCVAGWCYIISASFRLKSNKYGSASASVLLFINIYNLEICSYNIYILSSKIIIWMWSQYTKQQQQQPKMSVQCGSHYCPAMQCIKQLEGLRTAATNHNTIIWG